MKIELTPTEVSEWVAQAAIDKGLITNTPWKVTHTTNHKGLEKVTIENV